MLRFVASPSNVLGLLLKHLALHVNPVVSMFAVVHTSRDPQNNVRKIAIALFAILAILYKGIYGLHKGSISTPYSLQCPQNAMGANCDFRDKMQSHCASSCKIDHITSTPKFVFHIIYMYMTYPDRVRAQQPLLFGALEFTC